MPRITSNWLFFGALSRQCDGEWPDFAFDELWDYVGWDCVGGQEKSFVLMGVLVYFHQVHRIGMGTLQGESLTITRKGIVEFEHAALEDVFSAIWTCRRMVYP